MTSFEPFESHAFFCIDIEASGPVPGLYNLVSIGCCPVIHDGNGWQIGETWYAELRPTAPGFDPEAMAIHGLPREYLETHGEDPQSALQSMLDFCRDKAGRKYCKFVGHNAAFDWSYITHALVTYGLPNIFGYWPIDTKSLALGLFRVPPAGSGKPALRELMPELPEEDSSKSHRADYDAWYQAHILSGMLRRMA